MRILFALPGLHRFDRGAEVALLSIATELAKRGGSITLIGSGPVRPSVPYRYFTAYSVRRERFERWPKLPPFRSEYVFEEFTFTGGVAKNPAGVRALRALVRESYGERTINISPESIYMGALGAAIFALREDVPDVDVALAGARGAAWC